MEKDALGKVNDTHWLFLIRQESIYLIWFKLVHT